MDPDVQSAGNEVSAGRTAWLSGQTEVSGRTLAYQRSAVQGPPLVYVHGLYSSGTLGVPLLDELAGAGQVWTLDLPGHGRSSRCPDLSIEAAADMLCQFIRQECPVPLKSCVAHSMGCLVALQALAQDPDLAESLTLIFPPGRKDHLPFWVYLLGHQVLGRPAAVGMEVVNRLAWAVTRVIPRRGRGLRRLLVHALAAHQEETVGLVRSALQADQDSLLGGCVGRPVLILGGTKDHIIPPVHPQTLKDHLPCAELRWLPDGIHIAPHTDPRSLSLYIRAFLQRLDSPYAPPMTQE